MLNTGMFRRNSMDGLMADLERGRTIQELVLEQKMVALVRDMWYDGSVNRTNPSIRVDGYEGEVLTLSTCFGYEITMYPIEGVTTAALEQLLQLHEENYEILKPLLFPIHTLSRAQPFRITPEHTIYCYIKAGLKPQTSLFSKEKEVRRIAALLIKQGWLS